MTSGETSWRSVYKLTINNPGMFAVKDAYPDSCCTLKYPGCGQQAMATLSSDFANTFPDRLFTEGCLTVLR